MNMDKILDALLEVDCGYTYSNETRTAAVCYSDEDAMLIVRITENGVRVVQADGDAEQVMTWLDSVLEIVKVSQSR